MPHAFRLQGLATKSSTTEHPLICAEDPVKAEWCDRYLGSASK